MDTPSRTQIADNPELRIEGEGLVDDVDVLGLAVFERVKNGNFVDKILNCLVLLSWIKLIVGAVDFNDFESDERLVRLSLALYLESAKWKRESCR